MYSNYFKKGKWELKRDDGMDEEWGKKITIYDVATFIFGLITLCAMCYVALNIF